MDNATTPTSDTAWFALDPDTVVRRLEGDAVEGLSQAEAERRRERFGPNVIVAAPSPSLWQIIVKQIAEPMNIMLIAVGVFGVFIDQVPVSVMVGALVVLNVVLGTRQERAAQASVDALSKMQVPQVKASRDGSVRQLPATELVPGDLIHLEPGDIVPADGRIMRSASLETQEAALTGESMPIVKGPGLVPDPQTALGDRSSMVFQNTQVTRGTAAVLVTDTGMSTQMGRIASLLQAVVPTKSPLQRELGSLTTVLSIIAWGAVLVIVAIGMLRGQTFASVILVGISMAISAIPSGMPTFVQGMLSYGSRQLASHHAIVKSLADVETLGATSAINSDKTGTLTMNEMTARALYYDAHWFTVDGSGYERSGEIRSAAGSAVPDFTPLAYGLCLCSDATVSDERGVVGDPTEAALVVLAAKMGVDAELSRREYPRLAEVPFDSSYKFMATFHQVPLAGQQQFLALVKGGPDVILARCDKALMDNAIVSLDDARTAILAANQELSEQGLRVLAFAYRNVQEEPATVAEDPFAAVDGLTFVGLVGIIDPLRPSSVEAVRIAQEAGIEVRMITGDHAVTAAAIGAQLGLGAGAITGAELQSMTDAELARRLPELHVFGRVTPQDKLRIAQVMQQQGDIVAMTGDAVNDAAALKQADIGVAMGSGSEVTKQAGKMILTDDNFGTLVTAVRLGRGIYQKIVDYVRFQMSLLFSLVLLFLIASIFNINEGVPLTPLMVLFLNFFITMFPLVVIMLDDDPADIMSRPPRDPKVTISRPGAVVQWLFYGALLFLATLTPLLLWPEQLSPTEPNTPVSMAFVISAFSALAGGLAMRRDPQSGLLPPLITAIKWLSIPAALTVAAVELGFLQRWLGTTSLTGEEWLFCLGVSAIVPLIIEAEKLLRRRRARA